MFPKNNYFFNLKVKVELWIVWYSKLYKLTIIYEIYFYDSVIYGGGNPFSIFSNGILSMGYTVSLNH